jgi:hypothetical protein
MVFEKNHLQTVGQDGFEDLFPEPGLCRGSEEKEEKKDKQNFLQSRS